MTTKITTKSILFLPDIYPRFEVDQQRIRFFIELLENGKELPPLYIAPYDKKRKDGKNHVLLDGKHRTDAYVCLGLEEVTVHFFNIPREEWRLKAAAFNTAGSKQLTGEELKRVVIDAWVKDGMKDTQKIAKVLNGAFTVQHINRIVRPLRDQERAQRNTTVLKLTQEGHSSYNIADKLHIPRSTVRNIRRDSRVGHREHMFSVAYSGKLPDSNQLSPPQALNICPEMLNNDGDSDHDQAPEFTPQASSDDYVDRYPDDYPEEEPPSCLPGLLPVENTAALPDAAEQRAGQPGDIPPGSGSYAGSRKLSQALDDFRADNIKAVSSYIDSLKIYRALPPEDQQVVTTMELVKLQNQDAIEITDKIGKSISWVTKVLIAAISLALMGNHGSENVGKIAGVLEIDAEKVQIIQQFLSCGEMLRPTGPRMEQWVEENLSREDLGLIAKLTEINDSDLLCRIRGEKPSKTRNCKKLPAEELLKHVKRIVDNYRNVRDDVKREVYEIPADEEKRSIQACGNKLIIVNNEMQDMLRGRPEGIESYTGKGSAISGDQSNQLAGIIEKAVKKYVHRLPGIAEEDLKMECWVCALEALEMWEPTRSALKTWIENNFDWRFKNWCKKEYRRRETISRYRADLEVLEDERKDTPVAEARM